MRSRRLPKKYDILEQFSRLQGLTLFIKFSTCTAQEEPQSTVWRKIGINLNFVSKYIGTRRIGKKLISVDNQRFYKCIVCNQQQILLPGQGYLQLDSQFCLDCFDKEWYIRAAQTNCWRNRRCTWWIHSIQYNSRNQE